MTSFWCKYTGELSSDVCGTSTTVLPIEAELSAVSDGTGGARASDRADLGVDVSVGLISVSPMIRSCTGVWVLVSIHLITKHNHVNVIPTDFGSQFHLLDLINGPLITLNMLFYSIY